MTLRPPQKSTRSGIGHRLLWSTLVLAPLLAAAVWTCLPALQVVSAALSMTAPRLPEKENLGPEDARKIQRKIQQHFLKFDTYVPIEDIQIRSPDATHAFDLLMQKACGKGRLKIWLPLRFRLPVTGEKVLEWCWKPKPRS